MKNKDKDVDIFLKHNRQRLTKKEKVFYYMTNPMPKEPKLNKYDYFRYSLALLAALFIGSFIFSGLWFVFLVVLLVLILFGMISISDNGSATYIDKPFCLVTSRGLRLEKVVINWNAVYNIKKYNSKFGPVLVFELSPVQSPPEDQELDVSRSYENGLHLFLGGEYNAGELYDLILPYWEDNSPSTKIKRLNNRLKKKYDLEELKTTQPNFSLNGTYKDVEVSIDFTNTLPFKSINSSLELPDSVKTHLYIGLESGSAFFQQMLGVQDIQIGTPSIDNLYLFQSSHPDFVQQLFTESEIKDRFLALMKLGSVSWSFGQPPERKKLRPPKPKTSVHDDEDVLDTGFLEADDPIASYEIDQEDTSKTLEFNGILKPAFEEDPEKATEFTELSMELSVLLAHGLKELGNE